MSILIWGQRSKSIDLGQEAIEPCVVCERDRTFRTVLHYQLNHVYYVLGFVSNKQAYRLCEICGRGHTLNTAAVEAALGKSRIPFLDRFGCLGAAVGIAGLILLGVLFSTFAKPPRNIPDLIEHAERGNSSAFARLREEAAADDVPSQEALVQLLRDRDGAAETAEAFRWAKRAAELGSSWAQHQLGYMYEQGRGTKPDDAQAFRWFQAAEAQGNASSANSLGAFYLQGRGTVENPAEAARLFRKSADGGDPMGAYNLAMRYLDGNGVNADPAEASRWLEKAAAHEEPFYAEVVAGAKLELGHLYEEGRGVERDVVKALHLYEEASAANDDEARQNLDRLRALLSPP